MPVAEGSADQEDDTDQQACSQAEAALEIIVNANDAGSIQSRQDVDHQKQHRDGHGKLVGQPNHATASPQADERRRRDETDRRQLRRHRRQGQRKRAHFPTAEKIVFLRLLFLEEVPEAEKHAQVADYDSEVECIHDLAWLELLFAG